MRSNEVKGQRAGVRLRPVGCPIDHSIYLYYVNSLPPSAVFENRARRELPGLCLGRDLHDDLAAVDLLLVAGRRLEEAALLLKRRARDLALLSEEQRSTVSTFGQLSSWKRRKQLDAHNSRSGLQKL